MQPVLAMRDFDCALYFFNSQPQTIGRVIYNLPLRFYLIHVRCCLSKTIYKKLNIFGEML